MAFAASCCVMWQVSWLRWSDSGGVAAQAGKRTCLPSSATNGSMASL